MQGRVWALAHGCCMSVLARPVQLALGCCQSLIMSACLWM